METAQFCKNVYLCWLYISIPGLSTQWNYMYLYFFYFLLRIHSLSRWLRISSRRWSILLLKRTWMLILFDPKKICWNLLFPWGREEDKLALPQFRIIPPSWTWGKTHQEVTPSKLVPWKFNPNSISKVENWNGTKTNLRCNLLSRFK
jgi:hypothetical protein